jgi:CBS domain containing-hemolysin-like protein
MIRYRGFSRIPIYYGENETFIIGILIVKTLLGVDISRPKTIRELCQM